MIKFLRNLFGLNYKWVEFVAPLNFSIPNRTRKFTSSFKFRYCLYTKKLQYKNKLSDRWRTFRHKKTNEINREIIKIENTYLAETRNKVLKKLLK